MEIKEYQEKAHSTAIYPNRGKNLPYAVLGLIEESLETRDKINQNANQEEIEKELGDILWYVNATSFEIGVQMSSLKISRLEKKDLLSIDNILMDLAGKTKKHIRDDEGSLDPKKKDVILKSLNYLVSYVNQVAENNNSKLSTVMEKNIEKLFSRKERGVLKGSGDNR